MKDGTFAFDNVVRMFYYTGSNMTPGGHHVAGNDIAMARNVPLKRTVEAKVCTSDTRLRVQGRLPGSRAFCSRVADDRKLSYPMWQRCLEVGTNNVQFHKGVPYRWFDWLNKPRLLESMVERGTRGSSSVRMINATRVSRWRHHLHPEFSGNPGAVQGLIG